MGAGVGMGMEHEDITELETGVEVGDITELEMGVKVEVKVWVGIAEEKEVYCDNYRHSLLIDDNESDVEIEVAMNLIIM